MQQNPKVLKVGGIPGHPAPSSGQAQPEQVFLATSSQVLGFSTTFPDNLVQCLTTLTIEKVSPLFKWYFLCLFLCPLPLVLPLGITEPSFHPVPIRYLYMFIRLPKRLLFSRLNSPGSKLLLRCQMLQSLNHVSCSLLDSLHSMSLLYWGVQKHLITAHLKL